MHFTKITYLQFDGNCEKNMITYLKTKANFEINIARLQAKIIALFSETFFMKLLQKLHVCLRNMYLFQRPVMWVTYHGHLFSKTFKTETMGMILNVYLEKIVIDVTKM